MFIEQGEGFHWTFNPESSGRPKPRSSAVKCGYYVIEHMATGKLVLGLDKAVSVAVDQQLEQVYSGKHRLKAFVRLVQSDCELKVYEFPTLSVRDAKRFLGSLRASVTPTHLLLS